MFDLSSRTADTCFALLDDSTAPASAPRSRLYTGYAGTRLCHAPEELEGMLEAMQQELRKGRQAVVVFPYELGEKMHGIAEREAPAASARILLFEHCSLLSSEEVAAWLSSRAPAESEAGIVHPRAGISEEAFTEAIERIHAYIEAGDTYQVNFTYRLHFSAYGAVVELYRKLRARQPVPYGALITLPEGGAILSLSPELFLRHQAGKLTAQPMKGTAPASGDPQHDVVRAKSLASDEKNRAENVMIVDLLRNDLGRVAIPGSVRVPQLFEVTRYGSVLQMTSTITAQLRESVTLAELIRAVYPCGSITGAPKRRTMQIIRELEAEARAYYTGAIGWFAPPADEHPIGDFCLSVPIRTLELQAVDEKGLRKGSMGIGAGIVYDSDSAQEYAECQLKGRFLTEMPHGFELFETMRATREEGCRYQERHSRRLQASARFFGFAWNEAEIGEALRQASANFTPGLAYRLRLSLDQHGNPAVQSAPLPEIGVPVRLLRAAQSTDVRNLFLRHKTTMRGMYDAASRAAEKQGAFDTIFCNNLGEVTEGGRCSLFVRLQGKWYTPPLSAGLLPGVMRSVLLEDPAWDAEEKNLNWDDLRRAEKIVICNALRGVLEAHIDWDAPLVHITA